MTKALFDALSAFSEGKRVSFHMPANRGGLDFPEGFQNGFSAFETTELALTDDLNDPQGPGLLAERDAARFFGAERSFFFSSGSTMAIYTMLAAVCPPGSRLLCDPASHRSLAQIASLMCYELRFFPRKATASPGRTERSPISPIDLSNPDTLFQGVEALYITRPDYYGRAEDIRGLIQLAKSRDIPVLVDEAHGAHYRVVPELFPETALEIGADLVVQSLHKTLPVLAPASILHLSENRARDSALPGRICELRRFFQTSSPSFPIAASFDLMRERIEGQDYQELVKKRITRIDRLRRRVPPPFYILEASAADDPFRLVISHAELPLPLYEIQRHLQACGIDIEMADPRRLILITTATQPAEDDARLLDALHQLAERGRRASGEERREKETSLALEDQWQTCLTRARKDLSPGTAGFERLYKAGLDIGAAEEAIRGGKRLYARLPLGPYPPGIPLFYPGEAIEEADLDWLRDALSAGLTIPGMESGFAWG